MVALILAQGYEDVTVQDILERANVGRATFYAHYYDKDDLLLSGFEHIRVELDQQLASVGSPVSRGHALLPISRVLFRHAAAYHQVYKAMVGKRSGTVFLTQLHHYVETAVRDQLTKADAPRHDTRVPLEVAVHYIAGGLLALLTWWLDADCPHTLEQMELLFAHMSAPAMATMSFTPPQYEESSAYGT